MKKSNQAPWLPLVLLIAIIVLLNLISIYWFARLDISKGKIYTMSRSSRETVKQLEDNLIITAYFSKNLPNQYADLSRYVRDLLTDYQSYSHGRVRFQFIDPADETKLKEQALKNSIFPATIQVVQNDKMETREIYMGLHFEYRGNMENIGLVTKKEGLENDITSLIKRLSNKEFPEVGVFNNMLWDSSEYEKMNAAMSRFYSVQKIDLTTPVAGIKALLVTGTLDSLTNDQMYNLDQYLMKGGKLVIFQDRQAVDERNGTVIPLENNLINALISWGVDLKPNFVLDAICAQINFQQRRGIYVMDIPFNYPLMPIVNTTNKQNPISKNLSKLVFVFASEIGKRPLSPHVKMTPLLYTSNNSGVIVGPQWNIDFKQFLEGPSISYMTSPSKVLAAIFEGPIPSYFSHKEEANTPGFVSTSKGGELLVVGDSDFLRNNAGAQSESNIVFLLNSIDYMIQDQSLIEIRSRNFIPSSLNIKTWMLDNGFDADQINTLEPVYRKAIKWINILLPMIIIVLFGLRMRKQQKRRSKEIHNKYA